MERPTSANEMERPTPKNEEIEWGDNGSLGGGLIRTWKAMRGFMRPQKTSVRRSGIVRPFQGFMVLGMRHEASCELRATNRATPISLETLSSNNKVELFYQ